MGSWSGSLCWGSSRRARTRCREHEPPGSPVPSPVFASSVRVSHHTFPLPVQVSPATISLQHLLGVFPWHHRSCRSFPCSCRPGLDGGVLHVFFTEPFFWAKLREIFSVCRDS